MRGTTRPGAVIFTGDRERSGVRTIAASPGGKLAPPEEEWEARGFRACEAVDPDGNVIQFREAAP